MVFLLDANFAPQPDTQSFSNVSEGVCPLRHSRLAGLNISDSFRFTNYAWLEVRPKAAQRKSHPFSRCIYSRSLFIFENCILEETDKRRIMDIAVR